MKNKKNKIVAIIGAGPAGMAAALQLQRFGVQTILFEQSKTGSLLKNAWCVENYPGVCPGKSGVDLLQLFRKNLAKNKVAMITEKVESLDYNFSTNLFKIKIANKDYFVDYAIIASGTSSKTLSAFENAEENIKPNLFYEVFPLLKKRCKRIVIIGVGDVAFDNALNLAKNNNVMICNRGEDISAYSLLVEKTLNHKRIDYRQNFQLQSILPGINNDLECVFIAQRDKVSMEADYVLSAIGRLPKKDFYTKKVKLAEDKLIDLGKLFLVGDVKNEIYRQVAIATGDGILAAMRIFYG
jgi:thioredoxin reductase (NADPH)